MTSKLKRKTESKPAKPNKRHEPPAMRSPSDFLNMVSSTLCPPSYTSSTTNKTSVKRDLDKLLHNAKQLVKVCEQAKESEGSFSDQDNYAEDISCVMIAAGAEYFLEDINSSWAKIVSAV